MYTIGNENKWTKTDKTEYMEWARIWLHLRIYVNNTLNRQFALGKAGVYCQTEDYGEGYSPSSPNEGRSIEHCEHQTDSWQPWAEAENIKQCEYVICWNLVYSYLIPFLPLRDSRTERSVTQMPWPKRSRTKPWTQSRCTDLHWLLRCKGSETSTTLYNSPGCTSRPYLCT